MNVKCPECTTEYTLPENLLGGLGARVRCPMCDHAFEVLRSEPGDEDAATVASESGESGENGVPVAQTIEEPGDYGAAMRDLLEADARAAELAAREAEVTALELEAAAREAEAAIREAEAAALELEAAERVAARATTGPLTVGDAEAIAAELSEAVDAAAQPPAAPPEPARPRSVAAVAPVPPPPVATPAPVAPVPVAAPPVAASAPVVPLAGDDAPPTATGLLDAMATRLGGPLEQARREGRVLSAFGPEIVAVWDEWRRGRPEAVASAEFRAALLERLGVDLGSGTRRGAA